MVLGFASDHRGFKLKNELIKHFSDNGYSTIDYGTNSEESCDYPDFAFKLGNGVLLNEVDFGVAICGTGIGMSIALNKMKGIYCAKVSDPDEAIHTRYDNNTNVIALGEKMDLNQAILAIEQFIHTEYSFLEKHDRRNKKVRQIENGEYNG
jgi:ribose 5-phosphate isomerase B